MMKSMKTGLLVAAWLGGTLPAAFGQTTSVVDPAYQQSFEKWKTELVEDLKENWLPLAGLFWLKPGANSFGAGATNSIVLPEGSAPAQAGEFDLEGKEVTVKFSSGTKATIAGKPASVARLQPDISGKATVIELGKLRMHVIVRGERVGVRVKDLNSPAVRNYRGPIFYPLSAAYRVTARWQPSDGKKMVDVPNVLGDVTPTPVAGEARFEINGQDVSLTALGGDARKGLFFVFRDLTSKTDTYPPGRFLETGPVVDGTVVLDFNEAYNPPCAVTPYATCPLPPRQNRLTVAIPAGEKYDHRAGLH
jgi:uncharacterized protein